MYAVDQKNVGTCVSRVITHSAKALVAISAVLLIDSVQAQSGSNTPATITVGSMAEAMDTLVSRYGYAVTLETPRYLYAGDLEDQPAQTRNDADRVAKGTAPKILVPRSSPVTLTLPPPTGGLARDNMAGIAEQLAENASKSDHGAHFRVQQDGDVFHIIPTEIRDANGNWAPVTPIFDTPISIDTKERPLLETVKAVCFALEAAAHVKVGLLQAPMKTLISSNSTVGATNESARNVLTRALANSGNKLTWRVFYAEPLHKYLLSVFYVPVESPGAASTGTT